MLIIIIAAAAGGLLVLIVIIVVICVCLAQRRKKRREQRSHLTVTPDVFIKPDQGYQKKFNSKRGSGIRKTISKRFSGLWKPRTVRGTYDEETTEG